MIPVRAMVNPAAQSAQAELRLGLRRTIRAVHTRPGLVQKSIEFLAVMHTRVGHIILLAKAGLVEKLFERFGQHLEAKSYIARGCTGVTIY